MESLHQGTSIVVVCSARALQAPARALQAPLHPASTVRRRVPGPEIRWKSQKNSARLAAMKVVESLEEWKKIENSGGWNDEMTSFFKVRRKNWSPSTVLKRDNAV